MDHHRVLKRENIDSIQISNNPQPLNNQKTKTKNTHMYISHHKFRISNIPHSFHQRYH